MKRERRKEYRREKAWGDRAHAFQISWQTELLLGGIVACNERYLASLVFIHGRTGPKSQTHAASYDNQMLLHTLNRLQGSPTSPAKTTQSFKKPPLFTCNSQASGGDVGMKWAWNPWKYPCLSELWGTEGRRQPLELIPRVNSPKSTGQMTIHLWNV